MPLSTAIPRMAHCRTGRGRLKKWLLVSTLGMVLAASSCARQGSATNQVWARVDGTPIYRNQVEAVYRRRMDTLPDANKPQQALFFKLNILNELIDREILLERAAALQLTVSNGEVNARVAEMRGSRSPADFQKQLAQQGLTLAQLRQSVRENLTVQKLFQNEIVSRITVTPREIADYYTRNKADFNVAQTEYHLAQILVTPVADPEVRNLMHDDARNPREAQRKITALQALLRSGEDFSHVAEDYSEDPRTAPGGGDMGFVPASAFVADRPIKQALDSLRAGQVSRIIRDRSGYRIIKMLGKVEAGQRPLSDPQVQETIRKTLTDEKVEALKSALVEYLRNQTHVVDYLAQRIIKDASSPQAVQ